jgi:hypothetical protein
MSTGDTWKKRAGLCISALYMLPDLRYPLAAAPCRALQSHARPSFSAKKAFQEYSMSTAPLIRNFASCVVAVVLVHMLPTLATAEDFRVENKVFAADKTAPQNQGVTIFYGGVVYDYLEQPAEVIVLDKAAAKFTLLDTSRQVQTELSTQQVADFIVGLKKKAAANQDQFIRWLAEPGFQEQFDQKSGELTLVGPQMMYATKLAAVPSPEMAEQYREFSDWYVRLNTLLAPPGSLPPFPRMVLNQAIAKRQMIPREVERTLKFSATKRNTMRSEHELMTKLNAADLGRVTEAQQAMRKFTMVGFDVYRKGK